MCTLNKYQYWNNLLDKIEKSSSHNHDDGTAGANNVDVLIKTIQVVSADVSQ